MLSDPKHLPDRDKPAELDRHAWNLPSPALAPVGPAREVWPVREVPSAVGQDVLLEDPAAV